MSKGLIIHACVFNREAPGANTNILSSSITPKEGGTFLITVSLSTGSVFNYTVTDGTTTHTISLNNGLALTANYAYTFTIGCNPIETNSGSGNSLSWNFQVETDSIVEQLIVAEAQLGAP